MALDDSWRQLQNVHEAVRYADTKAGIILTLNGVLLGLLVVRMQAGGFFGAQPVAAAASVLAIALLAVSVAWDIAAVMPRRVGADGRGSLLYYERAGEQFADRAEDFVEEFVQLSRDTERLEQEIAAQVWANSVLARRKYHCIRWGLRFLAAALGVALVAAAVAAAGGGPG